MFQNGKSHSLVELISVCFLANAVNSVPPKRGRMGNLRERRPTRFLRYNLRTALALLTVLCLSFGWIFREVQHQRDQEALVQKLIASGYVFEIERVESRNGFSAAAWLDFFDSRYLKEVVSAHSPQTPLSLEDLRALARFESLTNFSLTRAAVPNPELLTENQRRAHIELTPEMLHAICDLSSLQNLHLSGTDLPQGHCAELGRLKYLTTLQLDDSNVNDSDLVALRQNKNLQQLNLTRCNISDAGVSYLLQFTNLEQLNLSGTKITDVGLAQLVALRKLRQLDVEHTAVTDQGVTSLQMHLPKLAMLTPEVGFRGRIRNDRRPDVEALKQLVGIELSGPFVTDYSLAWLRPAMKLRSLSLFESRITDVGIENLRALTNLSSVNIRDTAVTDHGLDALIQLPKLEQLLVGDQITDAGVKKISEVATLTFLSLSGPTISDDGLKSLARLLALKSCWLTVPQARGPGFEFLAALPELESLNLHDSVVTREIAAHIARAPALKYLEFYGGRMEGEALRALAPAARMKVMSFYSTQIDSFALPAIAAIPSLESITLHDCPNLTPDDGKRLLAMRPELRIWMRGPDGHSVQVQ